MDEVPQGDPPSAAPETPQRVDGRRQRSLRTRQALVDSYLALLRETQLTPTAEQVARRADLSERALFAHFADLEALGVAAFDHILTQPLSTPAGDKVGADRRTRIEFHIGIRARNCENWLPLWRVVQRGIAQSAEVARRAETVRGLIRARINLMYRSELSRLDETDRIATVAAIEAVVDFESWSRLRDHYGLSYEAACAAWTKTVDRLLPPTP